MVRSTAVFDPGPISELRELENASGPGLVNELIRLFQESAPQLLREIQSAIAEQDFESAGQAAHTLKSTAGNLGLVTISEIGGEIERLVLDRVANQRAKMKTLADALVALMPRALEVLGGQLRGD